MRRGVGAILFLAGITAACSGSSTAPSSTPGAQSAAPLGASTSTQGTGSGVEITGTVDALPPATAAGTFTVAGKMVATNASTVFADGGITRAFADLKVGMTVEVHATAAGTTLTATRVDIEDAAAPNPNPNPEPEPEPEPEPHAPAPPVANPPAPNAPSPLPPAPMPGHGDDDGNEVEAEGALGPVSGTCPSISSTVGATKFTTNASTRFDDVTCAALKSGSKVQVKGTRNPDGSIAATRVQKS